MSPELYQAGKQALGFLTKHSLVLYLSFILLALAGAIFLLYLVVETTFLPPQAQPSTVKGFDKDTVEKIKNLHNSGTSSGTVKLPSPRSSPFSE